MAAFGLKGIAYVLKNKCDVLKKKKKKAVDRENLLLSLPMSRYFCQLSQTQNNIKNANVVISH